MNASKEEIVKNLIQSILQYDPGSARQWAAKSVKADIDPIVTVRQMIEAIRQVGQRLSEMGRCFFPSSWPRVPPCRQRWKSYNRKSPEKDRNRKARAECSSGQWPGMSTISEKIWWQP